MCWPHSRCLKAGRRSRGKWLKRITFKEISIFIFLVFLSLFYTNGQGCKSQAWQIGPAANLSGLGQAVQAQNFCGPGRIEIKLGMTSPARLRILAGPGQAVTARNFRWTGPGPEDYAPKIYNPADGHLLWILISWEMGHFGDLALLWKDTSGMRHFINASRR